MTVTVSAEWGIATMALYFGVKEWMGSPFADYPLTGSEPAHEVIGLHFVWMYQFLFGNPLLLLLCALAGIPSGAFLRWSAKSLLKNISEQN